MVDFLLEWKRFFFLTVEPLKDLRQTTLLCNKIKKLKVL